MGLVNTKLETDYSIHDIHSTVDNYSCPDEDEGFEQLQQLETYVC